MFGQSPLNFLDKPVCVHVQRRLHETSGQRYDNRLGDLCIMPIIRVKIALVVNSFVCIFKYTISVNLCVVLGIL